MRYLKKFESRGLYYLSLSDFITLNDILVDITDEGYDYEMYSFFDDSWRVNPNKDSKIESIRVNFTRYDEKWDDNYIGLISEKLQSISNYSNINGLKCSISHDYQSPLTDKHKEVTKKISIDSKSDIDDAIKFISSVKTYEVSIRIFAVSWFRSEQALTR